MTAAICLFLSLLPWAGLVASDLMLDCLFPSIHSGLVASGDGTLCVSWSRDRTAKVFDVLNFDMIVMLRLNFTPGCAEWISKVGAFGTVSEKAPGSMTSPAQWVPSAL